MYCSTKGYGIEDDCKEEYLLPLGTCHEDHLCPDAVQAALAADGNGATTVQATLIAARNVGEGEELLCASPRILLWRQIGEEFTF